MPIAQGPKRLRIVKAKGVLLASSRNYGSSWLHHAWHSCVALLQYSSAGTRLPVNTFTFRAMAACTVVIRLASLMSKTTPAGFGQYGQCSGTMFWVASYLACQVAVMFGRTASSAFTCREVQPLELLAHERQYHCTSFWPARPRSNSSPAWPSSLDVKARQTHDACPEKALD